MSFVEQLIDIQNKEQNIRRGIIKVCENLQYINKYDHNILDDWKITSNLLNIVADFTIIRNGLEMNETYTISVQDLETYL